MRASAGILVVSLAVMLDSAPPSAEAGAGVPGIQADKGGSTRKVSKSQVEEDSPASNDSGATMSPDTTTRTEQPSTTPTAGTSSSRSNPGPTRDPSGANKSNGSRGTTKKVIKKTGGRPSSTATLAR